MAGAPRALGKSVATILQAAELRTRACNRIQPPHFQRCVKAQWSCPAECQRCSDCAPKGKARHETRENQGRCPDRIAERQAAQSEPKSLKKKRTGAGKKKND